jgi:predicted lipid-binding transport protein (Tim44 family)
VHRAYSRQGGEAPKETRAALRPNPVRLVYGWYRGTRDKRAMGSMMGGAMRGKSIILIVLLAIFLIWLVGLAATGTLIFWGLRRFTKPHAYC